MGLICRIPGKTRCFLRHKWKHGRESIPYTRINANNETVHRIENVRYCTRCHKKQRMTHKWVDWILTAEEQRDKKLNELGL